MRDTELIDELLDPPAGIFFPLFFIPLVTHPPSVFVGDGLVVPLVAGDLKEAVECFAPESAGELFAFCDRLGFPPVARLIII